MNIDHDRYNGPLIFEKLAQLDPKLLENVRINRVKSWLNRNIASPYNAEILATMMQTEEGQQDLIKAWWLYEAMPDSI
jgi:hypothetical protein